MDVLGFGSLMPGEWKDDLRWEQNVRPAMIGWIARTMNIGFDRWATLEEETEEHFDALMLNGVKVEIKSRRGGKVIYNDILIETKSCEERDTPGWIYTTQADYLAYAFVDEATHKILKGYLIHFSKLKEWWMKIGRYHEYDIRKGTTGKLYHTVNRAVPEKDFPLDLFYYHPTYGVLDHSSHHKIG